MKKPLVSIITPSFNQADYLEHTIRSVLEQDYPNIEYMVVDGGSTDGSVDIIKKYEKQLAWWVSEPDKGQSEAINKGFKRANGEIVAWLNSDDVYMPNAITRAVETLQANPEAAFVYANLHSINARGEHVNTIRYRQLICLHSTLLVNLPCFCGENSLIRRDSWIQVTIIFWITIFGCGWGLKRLFCTFLRNGQLPVCIRWQKTWPKPRILEKKPTEF